VAFWEFKEDSNSAAGPKFQFKGSEPEGVARGCSVSPVDDDESDLMFWTTNGFAQVHLHV